MCVGAPTWAGFALVSDVMASSNRDTAFFGHPIGLSTLFFTEMWERFSYYGGRALLMIYMTEVLSGGGRGMTRTDAGLVLSVYLSAVYLLSLPGGWIADRFIGQRAAVVLGGIVISAGNAMLAMPVDSMFYPGLAMIALGTGLLKPNASTVVGQLYGAKDNRRDSGYTIYYMGINLGAMIAPLVCGFLAQSASFRAFLRGHGIDPNWCWHFGFGAASLGMIVGLIQFFLTRHTLGAAGKDPHIPSDPARAAFDRKVLVAILGVLAAVLGLFAVASFTDGLAIGLGTVSDLLGIGLVLGSLAVFYGLYTSAHDRDEKRRVIAMVPLFIGGVAFFGVLEQASTTLSDFAERLTSRSLFGFTIEASYYQSVNSIFIIGLAIAFAWIWFRLARAGKEPSSVTKFAIGMGLVAVSFVVMLPTLGTVMHGGTVSGGYLIVLYFLQTCAELLISPVGMSSMSKLAPPRLAGMVMGTWFLGTADGNYLAGRAAGVSERYGYDFLFYFLIVASLIVAVALLVVSPMIRRMMDSEPAAPSGPSELAAARVINSTDAP